MMQGNQPLEIEAVTLNTVDNGIRFNNTILTWKDNTILLNGSLKPSGDHLQLTMDLVSERLLWEQLEELRSEATEEEEEKEPLPLRGTVSIRANNFMYQNIVWSPLYATVHLNLQGDSTVEISEATVCSVHTPATITISPNGVTGTVRAGARHEELAPALLCLTEQENLLTGSFTVTGEYHLDSPQPLGPSLLSQGTGTIAFEAEDGAVYGLGIIEKILSVVSLTDVFKGKSPDLLKEGLQYDRIHLMGTIEEGNLILEEVLLESSSMKMAGRGEINLLSAELDGVVLVAPVKLFNQILGYIPLLGDALGKLATVPVGIKGKISDPSVTPLSASAVSGNILDVMKETANLPLDIIQPIFPGKEKPEQAE